MDILPAVDIASGLALTHRQQDGREGATGADPAIVVREFLGCGARWIHLVDIDAAFVEFRGGSGQACLGGFGRS